MPFDIATGTYTEAEALQPSAPGTGVAEPTRPADKPTGPTIPGRDCTSEFQQQRQAGEADVRAAQAAGMTAEGDRRSGYMAQVKSHGGRIGDGMQFPPSPLDPGVGSLGSGQTDPEGAYYDPGRPGSPDTFLANTGNQPK